MNVSRFDVLGNHDFRPLNCPGVSRELLDTIPVGLAERVDCRPRPVMQKGIFYRIVFI